MEPTLAELIERIRSGDQQAATMLVAQYEPEIRRAVRIRLTDPALQPVLDSVDICQSIMVRFFNRLENGEFELDKPEQLFGLLVKMAHDRVIDWARKLRAQRRDRRRESSYEAQVEASGPLPGSGQTPSKVVAARELLDLLYERLSDDERRLAELRAEGRGWGEIAETLGEKPDALRKRLARAMERVAHAIDLD